MTATTGKIPDTVLQMDLDTATEAVRRLPMRPKDLMITRSLGEGDACAHAMDVVDDDLEMWGPPEVNADVEMTCLGELGRR